MKQRLVTNGIWRFMNNFLPDYKRWRIDQALSASRKTGFDDAIMIALHYLTDINTQEVFPLVTNFCRTHYRTMLSGRILRNWLKELSLTDVRRFSLAHSRVQPEFFPSVCAFSLLRKVHSPHLLAKDSLKPFLGFLTATTTCSATWLQHLQLILNLRYQILRHSK